MTEITPEVIKATGDAMVSVVAAIGAVVATIASALAAFYTWKNRYELDQLYAAKYRPNEDGTPGPMRRHPQFMVNMFGGIPKPVQNNVVATQIDTSEKTAVPPIEDTKGERQL